MSETTKIVLVAPGDVENVPDIGEWKSGEVKDVDNGLVRWLLQSEAFKVWEPAEDDFEDVPPVEHTETPEFAEHNVGEE